MLIASRQPEALKQAKIHLDLLREKQPNSVETYAAWSNYYFAVGRLAAAILRRVRRLDGSQSKLREHIDQKPSQVALSKPIVKQCGKQQRLVDRVRKEVLAHDKNRKP